jgi:hypothetical protein
MERQVMETFWKILKIIFCGFAIIFLALIVLEWFSPISHAPHGNRMTLIECHEYLNTVSSTKSNSTNFDFSKLTDDDKGRAIGMARIFDFWIKTNFVWRTGSNREIIIVCPEQFDNIPKPGFWNAFWRNPAHAVGYSDGSAGLISPEQFTNLNLSGFVSATNLAANIFKK